MSAIIDKVIQEAIRNLKSCGCQFAVITPSGDRLGDLEVKPVKIRKGTRPVNDWKSSGYIQVIEKMKPGDVEVLRIPGGDRRFQSAVCATAVRFFGKGNYQTVINGDHVEIMRLA